MRIFLIITLLIPLFSYSQFRATKWGWPPALVKQSEGVKEPRIDYSGDVIKSLYYIDEKIGIYDVALMYGFDRGVLVYASYLILEEYYDTQNHIQAFLDLKVNLSAKYGDQLLDEHKVWKDEKNKKFLGQNDVSALTTGEMEYRSNWLVEDHPYISLSLSQSADDLLILVNYMDAKLVDKNVLVNPYDGL